MPNALGARQSQVTVFVRGDSKGSTRPENLDVAFHFRAILQLLLQVVERGRLDGGHGRRRLRAQPLTTTSAATIATAKN